MPEIQFHHCGVATAKVIGRSLRASLKLTGASFDQEFGSTDWVQVCPVCEGSALGMKTGTPRPFLCQDGVMRVSTDYDNDELNAGGEILEFAGFRCSRAALVSAVKLVRIGDPKTAVVEDIGRRLMESPSPNTALEFTYRVCDWGRGHRVLGNLERFHTKKSLGKKVYAWLKDAGNMSPEEAIAIGLEIKGLGVSFASKHLRLAMPDRFGVLDEVISKGLGFAMNIAGYRLFHLVLGEFQSQCAREMSVSEIESGMFLLVRQGVRAKE